MAMYQVVLKAGYWKQAFNFTSGVTALNFAEMAADNVCIENPDDAEPEVIIRVTNSEGE